MTRSWQDEFADRAQLQKVTDPIEAEAYNLKASLMRDRMNNWREDSRKKTGRRDGRLKGAPTGSRETCHLVGDCQVQWAPDVHITYIYLLESDSRYWM